MAKEHLTPRETAERRIRQRHERARARLFKDRQEQRSALLHRQRAERAQLDEERALTNERRRQTLTEHERQWERERQRLANSTTRVPGFSLFGSPRRNLQAEYQERREHWERQHAAIEQAFDEQREKLQSARIETAERHARELTSHERWDRQTHDDLVRRQSVTFDAAVERELGRGGRTTRRTFERHAGDIGRER